MERHPRLGRVSFIRLIGASVILVGALGVPGHAHAASGPNPGDVIVADDGGTIYDVNPATGDKPILSDNDISTAAGGGAYLGDVWGIAREPDGDFIAISRDLGTDSDKAEVVRIDRSTGKQTRLAHGTPLTAGSALVSVGVSPSDQIIVGDEGANNGTLWDVNNAGTGAVTKLTDSNADSELTSPQGVLFTSSGDLYVLSEAGGDPSATDPDADRSGAILKIDPSTGAQLSMLTSNYISSSQGGGSYFDDIRAFTRLANGDFLVMDDPAVNGGPINGTRPPCNPNPCDASSTQLISVDGTTGKQTLLSTNAISVAAGGQGLFDRPYGIGVDDAGNIYVNDFNESRGGKLIKVNPANGAQTLVTSDDGFPVGLTVIPGTPVQHTLTVTGAGAGSGYVDSSPAGIDCGQNDGSHVLCSGQFEEGVSVSLRAHGEPGNIFSGFTGCSGTDSPCQVTMSADEGVTATFDQSSDVTPPNTTKLGGPRKKLRSSHTTFRFGSTEASSTFQCSLDAHPFTDCSSPMLVTGLRKGRHTFRAEAIDRSNNVDPTPATWSFKVVKRR